MTIDVEIWLTERIVADAIEFEYEGHGRVRLEAGSCAHQPTGLRHQELGHSADLEMLEVALPADFATQEVESVNP